MNMPVHPYLPNTAPSVRRQMLDAVGVDSVDELFAAIPPQVRAPSDLGLPKRALASEPELRRYIEGALKKNLDTTETLSFLGGGCWLHSVPAVCDEIASRGEFTSAMIGLAGASTTGAYQAMFEYQSLMCELLELEVACLPLFDWGWAAGSAMVMAAGSTGRSKILIADTVSPNRRREIVTRLSGVYEIVMVGHDPNTGAVDLDELQGHAPGAAALYFENPSYLGTLEPELDRVRELTSATGTLLIAGVDPTSLGVVRPPGSYGADLACGDLQPLGTHQQFGGGSAGFLASNADSQLVTRIPNIYIGAFPTSREGEFDFHWANFEETSYERRAESEDVIGCGSLATSITAAVYLSLMGPTGMQDLGNGLRARSSYLMQQLGKIPDVSVRLGSGAAFKEIVVDFSATNQTFREIAAALFERGIFGGIDLTDEYLEFPQCGLIAVSEVHTIDDIDRFVSNLTEVLR